VLGYVEGSFLPEVEEGATDSIRVRDVGALAILGSFALQKI
jgi:hypothetical protein